MADIAELVARLRDWPRGLTDGYSALRLMTEAADALEAAARELSAERAAREAAQRDSERIDWLQAQKKGYGNGWIVRDSTRGRGMRLHETSRGGAQPTVRAAIDAARGSHGA